MSKRKLLLIFCLLLILIVAFVGCGNPSDGGGTGNTETGKDPDQTVTDDLKSIYAQNLSSIIANDTISQEEKNSFVNNVVYTKDELLLRENNILADSKDVFNVLKTYPNDVQSVWKITNATEAVVSAGSFVPELKFVPQMLYSTNIVALKEHIKNKLASKNYENYESGKMLFLNISKANFMIADRLETKNGLVLDKDNKILFSSETATGKVVVPSTIERIQKGAFINNKNITSIEIPDTVKVVQAGAITGCDNATITVKTDKTSVPDGWDSNFTDSTDKVEIKPNDNSSETSYGPWEEVVLPSLTTIGKLQRKSINSDDVQYETIDLSKLKPVSHIRHGYTYVDKYEVKLDNQTFIYFTNYFIDESGHKHNFVNPETLLNATEFYPGIKGEMCNTDMVAKFTKLPATGTRTGKSFYINEDSKLTETLESLNTFTSIRYFATTNAFVEEYSSIEELLIMPKAFRAIQNVVPIEGKPFQYSRYEFTNRSDGYYYIENGELKNRLTPIETGQQLLSDYNVFLILEDAVKTNSYDGIVVDEPNPGDIYKLEYNIEIDKNKVKIKYTTYKVNSIKDTIGQGVCMDENTIILSQLDNCEFDIIDYAIFNDSESGGGESGQGSEWRQINKGLAGEIVQVKSHPNGLVEYRTLPGKYPDYTDNVFYKDPLGKNTLVEIESSINNLGFIDATITSTRKNANTSINLRPELAYIVYQNDNTVETGPDKQLIVQGDKGVAIFIDNSMQPGIESAPNGNGISPMLQFEFETQIFNILPHLTYNQENNNFTGKVDLEPTVGVISYDIVLTATPTQLTFKLTASEPVEERIITIKVVNDFTPLSINGSIQLPNYGPDDNPGNSLKGQFDLSNHQPGFSGYVLNNDPTKGFLDVERKLPTDKAGSNNFYENMAPTNYPTYYLDSLRNAIGYTIEATMYLDNPSTNQNATVAALYKLIFTPNAIYRHETLYIHDKETGNVSESITESMMFIVQGNKGFETKNNFYIVEQFPCDNLFDMMEIINSEVLQGLEHATQLKDNIYVSHFNFKDNVIDFSELKFDKTELGFKFSITANKGTPVYQVGKISGLNQEGIFELPATQFKYNPKAFGYDDGPSGPVGPDGPGGGGIVDPNAPDHEHIFMDHNTETKGIGDSFTYASCGICGLLNISVNEGNPSSKSKKFYDDINNINLIEVFERVETADFLTVTRVDSGFTIFTLQPNIISLDTSYGPNHDYQWIIRNGASNIRLDNIQNKLAYCNEPSDIEISSFEYLCAISYISTLFEAVYEPSGDNYTATVQYTTGSPFTEPYTCVLKVTQNELVFTLTPASKAQSTDTESITITINGLNDYVSCTLPTGNFVYDNSGEDEGGGSEGGDTQKEVMISEKQLGNMYSYLQEADGLSFITTQSENMSLTPNDFYDGTLSADSINTIRERIKSATFLETLIKDTESNQCLILQPNVVFYDYDGTRQWYLYGSEQDYVLKEQDGVYTYAYSSQIAGTTPYDYFASLFYLDELLNAQYTFVDGGFKADITYGPSGKEEYSCALICFQDHITFKLTQKNNKEGTTPKEISIELLKLNFAVTVDIPNFVFTEGNSGGGNAQGPTFTKLSTIELGDTYSYSEDIPGQVLIKTTIAKDQKPFGDTSFVDVVDGNQLVNAVKKLKAAHAFRVSITENDGSQEVILYQPNIEWRNDSTRSDTYVLTGASEDFYITTDQGVTSLQRLPHESGMGSDIKDDVYTETLLDELLASNPEYTDNKFTGTISINLDYSDAENETYTFVITINADIITIELKNGESVYRTIHISDLNKYYTIEPPVCILLEDGSGNEGGQSHVHVYSAYVQTKEPTSDDPSARFIGKCQKCGKLNVVEVPVSEMKLVQEQVEIGAFYYNMYEYMSPNNGEIKYYYQVVENKKIIDTSSAIYSNPGYKVCETKFDDGYQIQYSDDNSFAKVTKLKKLSGEDDYKFLPNQMENPEFINEIPSFINTRDLHSFKLNVEVVGDRSYEITYANNCARILRFNNFGTIVDILYYIFVNGTLYTFDVEGNLSTPTAIPDDYITPNFLRDYVMAEPIGVQPIFDKIQQKYVSMPIPTVGEYEEGLAYNISWNESSISMDYDIIDIGPNQPQRKAKMTISNINSASVDIPSDFMVFKAPAN